MGKKIRYQLLTGSLLKPIFQFTSKLQIGINPLNDPKGSKMGEHLHKWASSTKPKFKGQKFQSKIDYDMTSSSSYVIFHYLNGWKQGFLLKHDSMDYIMNNHKLINSAVECTFMLYGMTSVQRAMEGYEDEYEDEEKM